MGLRTVLRATAVGGALMLVSGCATTHAHSAQSICEAAGGTYAQNICQPGTPRSGRQICEKMEARWVQNLGVCELGAGRVRRGQPLEDGSSPSGRSRRLGCRLVT